MKGAKLGGAAAAAAPASPISRRAQQMSPMVLGDRARVLHRRLRVLRDAVRGRRLDGEQRAGSAAGGDAGDGADHERVALVNPVMLAPNGKLAVVLSWLPWSSPIIMPIRMGLTSRVAASRSSGRCSSRSIGSVRRDVALGAHLSRRHADVRQEAELR